VNNLNRTSPNTQRTIITHSVLLGLTPLIPIPVVDDLAQRYFQRRMIKSLATAHGIQLDTEHLDALASDRGGQGCVLGCLSLVIIYPLKKIFRKVFYFLEWKRAVDLASTTYHYGYLIDYLFSAWGHPASTGRAIAEVRDAIDAVCREAPIKPLESAIKGTFRQSKGVLMSGAGLLERSFRRIMGKADENRVAQAVESVEVEEEREIEGVVDRLERQVNEIPSGHFETLKAQLAARLKS
jgi:hypothetical protein